MSHPFIVGVVVAITGVATLVCLISTCDSIRQKRAFASVGWLALTLFNAAYAVSIVVDHFHK